MPLEGLANDGNAPERLHVVYLGIGTIFERFHTARRRLDSIDTLNIEAIKGKSLEVKSLSVRAAKQSGPVAE